MPYRSSSVQRQHSSSRLARSPRMGPVSGKSGSIYNSPHQILGFRISVLINTVRGYLPGWPKTCGPLTHRVRFALLAHRSSAIAAHYVSFTQYYIYMATVGSITTSTDALPVVDAWPALDECPCCSLPPGNGLSPNGDFHRRLTGRPDGAAVSSPSGSQWYVPARHMNDTRK